MFGHTLLPGTIVKHENSTSIGEQRIIVPSDSVNGTPVLGIRIPEPTSPFRLRAARSGGEDRQLAVRFPQGDFGPTTPPKRGNPAQVPNSAIQRQFA
jgi:hypothetical protein